MESTVSANLTAVIAPVSVLTTAAIILLLVSLALILIIVKKKQTKHTSRQITK